MSMVPRPVNSGTDDERFGSESIEAPPPHPVVSNGLEDAGRFWEGDPDALAFLAGARNLRDGVEPKHMDMAPAMIGANGRFGIAPMPTGLPIDSSYAGIKPLWLVEKQAIEEAIVRCGGSIPRAADALGVSPSTIYRKKQAWEENGAK